MDQTDLLYAPLKTRIQPIEDRSGLGESASFLVWFLQNVYRLDDTDARDAVCDHPNDKGIDGIYIDHNNEEIHFLQAKIRQKDSKVGDVGPKNLMASAQQFDSANKIDAILSGNADTELKRLLVRSQVAEMVANGYAVVGVYVSNELNNKDSIAYAAITPQLRIYDRTEIASRVVDLDNADDQKDSFTFDTSYVEPMVMHSGSGTSAAAMYVFPAKALQLVHMEGISDGSLFKANVRYTLGNTAVNKSIRGSIANKKTHGNFVHFHNGIIILCSEVDADTPGQLTIKNYSVVNGAQSLTSFHAEKSKLSDELRVLVRVVVVQDEELAKAITQNSNNQNAIRPRDLRSNHALMTRLQNEMAQEPGDYFFEIKRGETAPAGSVVITNDETGRALLSFDLGEPWAAHQIYKVFDEKYAAIFGRPEVTSRRVVFIHRLLGAVDAAMPRVKNKPMASYALTKFFVLHLLGKILRSNDASRGFVSEPALLTGAQMDAFITKCGDVLKTVVVDLNYESNSPDFDYKTVLKSQVQVAELTSKIIASYEKDVERDKAESFDGWVPVTA